MKSIVHTLLVVAACLAIGVVAYAVVTIDGQGFGFAGKGDVQLACGWNNARIQANADDVKFQQTATTTEVTDHTWDCTNTNNQTVQERERTTTTTTATTGVVTTVVRMRNQVNGFNLEGWDGPPATSSSTETTGNQLWSCPTNWTLSNQVTTGPTTTTSSAVEVSCDGGTNWVVLQ